MKSESLAKAQKKYEQKIVRKTIKFNIENQEDLLLLEHIHSVPNLSNYIKSLIRESMLSQTTSNQ